jgi:integrase
MLGNYLCNVWQENPSGLLFPNRNGRPRKRQYVVKFGLKPLLRKLVLPTKDVGLHAFRNGLGTALANSKVSPKIVQQVLRHTDVTYYGGPNALRVIEEDCPPNPKLAKFLFGCRLPVSLCPT